MYASIHEIGSVRGLRRIWLEGDFLAREGFEQKTPYEIISRDGKIVLKASPTGYRAVSGRSDPSRAHPIIELKKSELLAMFDGLEHVRVIANSGEIEIEPLASELRARERYNRTLAKMEKGEALKIGSLAHGGGVMSHAIHTGLSKAGVTTKLAFANEMRHDLMQQSMSVNPIWDKDSVALCGKMQELAFDPEVMRHVPHVDALEMGLACQAASQAGRAKTKMLHPESHPDYGHLIVSAIAFIVRCNPTMIIFEQVVPYLNTASMDILRTHLRELHYEIHETILHGEDWNSLEPRKRMLMVAVTRGMPFSFDWLKKPAKQVRTLSEFLEPISLDDPAWKTMDGLKEKEQRDAEAGKSFAMQIFDGTSTKICTLTKQMTKNRSTDAKWRHPHNPDLLRVPLAIEHARLKQIPTALIAGLSETIAHEMCGQSVIYDTFVSVGEAAAQSFKGMQKQVPVSQFDDLPLFKMAA